ncbi:MAG: hypothetical protein AB1746_12735 [Candidatus Zixiibacteriota bacterium]
MKNILIIPLSLILLLSLACSKKAAEKIDLGIVENAVYTNKYFNFSLDLSDNWQIQENQTIQMMRERGKKLLSGDDEDLQAALDLGDLTTVNLLLASKYPMGADVAFNPNIAIVAEKIDPISGVLSGKDYLASVAQILSNSRIQTQFDGTYGITNLGGVDFDNIKVSMTYQDRSISQQYFASIIKGYAMSIIISYTTEDQYKTLDDLLKTIRFR